MTQLCDNEACQQDAQTTLKDGTPVCFECKIQAMQGSIDALQWAIKGFLAIENSLEYTQYYTLLKAGGLLLENDDI